LSPIPIMRFFFALLALYATQGFASLPSRNLVSQRLPQEKKVAGDQLRFISNILSLRITDNESEKVVACAPTTTSSGNLQLLRKVLQVGLGLSMINIWVFRSQLESQYRGGSAKNMAEEFASYGLPVWSMYVVGALKVTASLLLLAGLKYSALIEPAAMTISALMIGAVAMHAKVGDDFKKFQPAVICLSVSLLIAYLREKNI
jgi:uncharacterized membrane protein YphA (DoxX/SURF4 family)